MSVDPCTLATLPPEALRPLANWFRAVAASLEEAAGDADAVDARRRRLRARRQVVKGAAEVLATYIHAGHSPDQAVATVAKLTGLEPQALQVALPAAMRRKTTLEREKRNREIMQLVSKGWTDQEIGDRFKLHPKSVNRIVATERRRAA